MSRLADAVTRSQQIAIAALEEAYRAGHAEIDLDDLLVALVAVAGPAGDTLRSLGITVDAARAATARVHATRLEQLGLPAPSPQPRHLPRSGGGTLPWSDRADRVLRLKGERWSDDRAVLRALVREPSGFVAEVLAHLGVEAEQVERAADDWQPVADEPAGALHTPDPRPWRTATRDGWVPASPAQVWALVTDPARRTEWDGWYDAVEVGPDGTAVGILHAAGDRRQPARPGLDRHDLVVVGWEEGRLVEWEMRFPVLPQERAGQRLAVALTAANGGTRVDLTIRWPVARGLRRVLQALAHPVMRLMYRQMLLQKNAAISHALR